jgi:hypothetical protein
LDYAEVGSFQVTSGAVPVGRMETKVGQIQELRVNLKYTERADQGKLQSVGQFRELAYLRLARSQEGGRRLAQNEVCTSGPISMPLRNFLASSSTRGTKTEEGVEGTLIWSLRQDTPGEKTICLCMRGEMCREAPAEAWEVLGTLVVKGLDDPGSVDLIDYIDYMVEATGADEEVNEVVPHRGNDGSSIGRASSDEKTSKKKKSRWFPGWYFCFVASFGAVLFCAASGLVARATIGWTRRRNERKQQVRELQTEIPKLTRVDVFADELPDDACPICLGDLSDEDSELMLLPCKHLLHKECVFEWMVMRLSCPLCRCPTLIRDCVIQNVLPAREWRRQGSKKKPARPSSAQKNFE